MGPVFNISSKLQSLVLHLRLVFIFSFFLFSTNVLVAKPIGKHASIFGIFAYMFFFFNHLCHDDVGKISIYIFK